VVATLLEFGVTNINYTEITTPYHRRIEVPRSDRRPWHADVTIFRGYPVLHAESELSAAP
jgi:hypothetical protein